jgi:FAD/FMN-containing dehydrogenase
MLDELKLALADKVLNDEAIKDRYCHIWKMDKPLQAKAVILPRSTEDVSIALKICHKHNQPVVVHGGLTNLVGSTDTTKDDVVISLEKMNAIEEVDEKSRTMTVEAGVILENILNAAKEKNMFFPITFGAKGSAQIGGLIATNAGGMRVLRYGMTRKQVLGLEAVLADGTIVSSLKKIIKDNSGYDLKQLFIGSEGTLGIVTKAVIRLEEAPRSRNSAFVGLDTYDQVVRFLKFMDTGLSGTLSAFELLWDRNYKAMTTYPSPLKAPLPYGYKFYVLVESLGGDQLKDHITLEQLLEKAIKQGLILDAAIAQSSQNFELFWKIREEIDILVAQCKYDQHYDISIPIPLIGDYVENVFEGLKKISEVHEYFAHGHVADGNIHFLIGKNNPNIALTNEINKLIYEPLKNLGGSVSAEHGIGVHKKAYLHLSKSDEEIQLMKTIKKSLDPKNLLNRGKIFDL